MRIIAETGAGQHGVATATACTRFGLEYVVYMGAQDVRRQELNVFRMQMLSAKVSPPSKFDLHTWECYPRLTTTLGRSGEVRISDSKGRNQ